MGFKHLEKFGIHVPRYALVNREVPYQHLDYFIEEEEPSDFSLFKRIFRVHPEDGKSSSANENNGGLFESSPGTENFFRKLFRDRDRSIEDSELLGSQKQKEV